MESQVESVSRGGDNIGSARATVPTNKQRVNSIPVSHFQVGGRAQRYILDFKSALKCQTDSFSSVLKPNQPHTVSITGVRLCWIIRKRY